MGQPPSFKGAYHWIEILETVESSLVGGSNDEGAMHALNKNSSEKPDAPLKFNAWSLKR